MNTKEGAGKIGTVIFDDPLTIATKVESVRRQIWDSKPRRSRAFGAA